MSSFSTFDSSLNTCPVCLKRFKPYSQRCSLPKRLFSLQKEGSFYPKEFCSACITEASTYGIISHVWGDVTPRNHSYSGISWNLPLSKGRKIRDLIHHLRVAKFDFNWIWMDILCIDQSTGEASSELPKYE